ncbi:hypothetical protein ACFL5Q_07005 [Planctomycetota bacterium]
MNFAFFESLSVEDARDYLSGFLETESAAIGEMRDAAEQACVAMDHSIASVPHVLKWILKDVQIVRISVPASEPDWVQQAHADGLIDFEEGSKYLILRAAYYMGECFVRACPSLHWTIGDPEYIEKNMPVVAGFRSGTEMAPMMIVGNLFARILGDDAPITDIDRAVATWGNDIPSRQE